MRHIPEQVEPDAPLPQGSSDDAYPVNEQHLADFNVGGVERSLPPEQQLEQLLSYMESSYPVPAASDPEAVDRYLAALPDRLTHAAMLMLGSGLDHTMPGVAYGAEVEIKELSDLGATLFVPSGETERSGGWAVSAHPGLGPRARDHYWRPLVAAVAQLSGIPVVDVDSPEDVDTALDFCARKSSTPVTVWGATENARAVAEQHSVPFVDAGPLVHPVDGSVSTGIGTGPGIIATPEEFRRITRDAAQKLSGGDARV